jgi:VWFA-related protein
MACLAPVPLAIQLDATGFEQERPVFRASATAVSVDVSVLSGNQPVGGLSIGDFSLTDRGVPQEIALMEVSAIPVDVTVVVDVSARAMDKFERWQSDVYEIAALLRSEDRLRIISFGYDVVEALALQPVAGGPQLERTVTPGGRSLHDAVAAALVQRPEPDRRRLVVVLADRIDSLSVLHAGKVLAIARRADAVLHFIGLQDGCGPRSGPTWRKGEPMPPDFIPKRAPVRGTGGPPCSPDDFETLTTAAEATGGSVHGLSWISSSAVRGFKRAFDDFRSSYVLRYVARGVALKGWHDIDVKVLRPGRFTVRARKGYFIDGTPPDRNPGRSQ